MWVVFVYLVWDVNALLAFIISGKFYLKVIENKKFHANNAVSCYYHIISVSCHLLKESDFLVFIGITVVMPCIFYDPSSVKSIK